MSWHAFIDESGRGQRYLICAATISTGDLDATRRAMRALCARGQRRLHFATESDQRRRTILTEISKLDVTSVVYIAKNRDQVRARSAIIRSAAVDLHAGVVTRLVLESREGQDHRDRSDIYAALGPHPNPALEYTHHSAANEPLLWVPDAVAWACGRGNTWHRRVLDLGLVAHEIKVEAP